MSELSESIRSEARGGGKGKVLPAALEKAVGLATGFATNVRQGASSSIEVESLLPTVPFSSDEGIFGSLSPASSKFAWSGYSRRFSLDLGMGYYRLVPGAGSMTGSAAMATMIGSQVAIGTKNIFYGLKQEHILNFVWQIPDSGFRLKASGGYMWGGEDFDFPSGRTRSYLHQYSGLVSIQYVLPEDRSPLGLQSVGLSGWGTRAGQDEAPGAPRSYIVETPTEWRVMDDPLKLSEGRLMGVACDAQVAVLPEVVGKVSAGYERLEFPFADGSRERNDRLFWSGGLDWQPFSGVVVGVDYLSGVSERRSSLKIESGAVALSGFYSRGQNGVADNTGITMSFQLIGPKNGSPSAGRRGDDAGAGEVSSASRIEGSGVSHAGIAVASASTSRTDEEELPENDFGSFGIPVPESLKRLDADTRRDAVRYIKAVLASCGVKGRPSEREIDRNSLAWKMKPSRNAGPPSLLAEASSRPERFPQGFIAKPDLTALSVVNIIRKSGLPEGTTISTQGDVTIPIPGGMPSISAFLKNGADYPYADLLSTGDSVVVLHSRGFPSGAAGGDTWIVRGLDGGGQAYQIVIETE